MLFSKDEAITKIIIDLAKNLHLDVIDEGVENEEQEEFLRRKRCNKLQGYYYYKPMSEKDMDNVLRTQNQKEHSRKMRKIMR